MPRAINLLSLAAISFLPASGIIALAYMLAYSALFAPIYELRATDNAGNLYIAGSGSDCQQAALNAVYPANLYATTCERVR